MRGKCHKWKCLLLAVFVLCTGLYIETVKTVSVFEYASVSVPGAYMYVADNTYDEAQLCTAETVGARNVNSGQVLETSTNYSRRAAKLSFEFLCSMCVLLQAENISAYQEKVEFKIPYHQKVIANYIHKSDGKK